MSVVGKVGSSLSKVNTGQGSKKSWGDNMLDGLARSYNKKQGDNFSREEALNRINDSIKSRGEAVSHNGVELKNLNFDKAVSKAEKTHGDFPENEEAQSKIWDSVSGSMGVARAGLDTGLENATGFSTKDPETAVKLASGKDVDTEDLGETTGKVIGAIGGAAAGGAGAVPGAKAGGAIGKGIGKGLKALGIKTLNAGKIIIATIISVIISLTISIITIILPPVIIMVMIFGTVFMLVQTYYCEDSVMLRYFAEQGAPNYYREDYEAVMLDPENPGLGKFIVHLIGYATLPGGGLLLDTDLNGQFDVFEEDIIILDNGFQFTVKDFFYSDDDTHSLIWSNMTSSFSNITKVPILKVLIAEVMRKFAKDIDTFFKAAVDAGVALVKFLKFISDTVVDLVELVLETLRAFFNGLMDFITDPGSFIGNAVDSFFGSIPLVEHAYGGVKDGVEWVVNAFDKVRDYVGGIIGEKFKSFYNSLKNVPFLSEVMEGFENIVDVAKNVIEVLEKTVNLIKEVIELIRDGINKIFDIILDAMEGFKKALDFILEKFDAICDIGLEKGVQGCYEGMHNCDPIKAEWDEGFTYTPSKVPQNENLFYAIMTIRIPEFGSGDELSTKGDLDSCGPYQQRMLELIPSNDSEKVKATKLALGDDYEEVFNEENVQALLDLNAKFKAGLVSDVNDPARRPENVQLVCDQMIEKGGGGLFDQILIGRSKDRGVYQQILEFDLNSETIDEFVLLLLNSQAPADSARSEWSRKATLGLTKFLEDDLYQKVKESCSDFEDSECNILSSDKLLSPIPNAIYNCEFNDLGTAMCYWTSYGGAHRGIDIGGVAGTPIYASAEGSFVRSWWSNCAGDNFQIDYNIKGEVVTVLYVHAKADSSLSPGDKVDPTEKVGELTFYGATACTTGSHLHFQVEVPAGTPVNPCTYTQCPALGQVFPDYSEYQQQQEEDENNEDN